MAPDELTADVFAPLVGDEFAVADGVALRLSEVTALPGGGPRHTPFRLTFTGPPQPALTQGTFRLVHASLGTLEMFLVPVAPATYDALFN